MNLKLVVKLDKSIDANDNGTMVKDLECCICSTYK